MAKSKLSKILKISLAVFGILLLLFGGIGGIIELSAEKADVTGLILSPIFMVLGILLIYLGIRKPSPPKSIQPAEDVHNDASTVVRKEIPTETPASLIDEGTTATEHPLWKKKFLIISAYIEAIFIVVVIVVAVIFGYAGFEGGGMGVIIGFAMFFGIIMFGAIIAVRVVSLRGIQNNKRWATLLNMSLMILLTVILLFNLNPLSIYTGFVAWVSYSLFKDPSFT